MVGFPLANLIFEAQAHLLGFLRKVVDLLVTPGKSHEDSEEWTKLTLAGFRASGEVECWSTYSNQPFSAPPVFDAMRWLEQTGSQLEDACDHLHLLQTDPAYLQKCMKPVIYEKFHAKQDPDMTWFSKASQLVLWDSMYNIRRLRQIYEQCQYLVALEDLEQKIPDRPASPRYEMALSMLAFLLFGDLDDWCTAIKCVIQTEGDFRRSHKYYCNSSGKLFMKLKWNTGTLQGQKQLLDNDPLLSTLLTLAESSYHTGSPNKSLAMQLLDDCLKDPNERRRISPTLYAFLSMFVLYDTMLGELDHLRPRIVPFDPETMMEFNEETWLAIRYQTSGPRTPNHDELQQVVLLLKKVCEKPWPKGKKDEKWLAEADLIRQQMRDLWFKARSIIGNGIARCGPLSGMCLEEIEKELHFMCYDCTYDYQAEIDAEHEESAKYCQARDAAKAVKLSALGAALETAKSSTPQVVWGEEQDEKTELSCSRTKAKTRSTKPTPDRNEADVQAVRLAAVLSLDAEPAPVPIEVNAESMRIFAKMFSSSDESKGIVKWQQVVTAMTDAGFAATHCGGSAVSFVPVENAPMTGAIVFHKPHPEPNVDSVMLHCMGKRLKKWFDWGAETFVEKQKSKD